MNEIAKIFDDIHYGDLTHQEKLVVEILIKNGYLIKIEGTFGTVLRSK